MSARIRVLLPALDNNETKSSQGAADAGVGPHRAPWKAPKGNSMKKLSALLLCALGVLGVEPAFSQPDTNAPPSFTPQGFLTSFKNYFLTSDTNSTTFTTHDFDVWAGADYVQGVNTAQSLGLEYDFYHLSNKNVSLSAESVTRNAGIAGIILNQQVGLGLNLTHFDTKITGFIDGGYDFDGARPYAAIGARIKKALTVNTFGGLGIEEHFGTHSSRIPTMSIFAGAVF